MKETDFIALDEKIKYLVETCQKLQDENRQLRQEKQAWEAERVRLNERNDVAMIRVDAMINRMRALEQET